MVQDLKRGKPRVVVIGAGVSGIITAIQYKRKLGIDVQLFERNSGPGGTWHINTYPGCACDVPSHWYSFSEEQNPDWSHKFSGQPEIQKYWEDLFAKYKLAKQTRFGVNFLSAYWDKDRSLYVVSLCPVDEPKNVFTCEAEILYSAIGGFSSPIVKPEDLPGISRFDKPCFHSARWDHSVDLRGKRVGVIGNGCSAAQFIPIIAQDPTTKVINFSRTPSWFFPRPNAAYSDTAKWILRHVPMSQRLYRALLVSLMDVRWPIWLLNINFMRKEAEKQAIEHIKKTAPKELHDFLIPKYPIGCKRIVMDPGYLECLNQPNVELVTSGIKAVTEKGIVTTDGNEHELDVLILGTGFNVSAVGFGINVKGNNGKTITQQWDEQGGPQAYMGTTISGFPNFFTLLGPNVATGHSSAIASIECQVNYSVDVVKAMIDAQVDSLEVSPDAEAAYNSWLHKRLGNTVWKNCTSWYKLANGKVVATWPGTFIRYWWLLRSPRYDDYIQAGGRYSIARRKGLEKAFRVVLSVLAAGLVTATLLGRLSLRVPR